MLCIEQRMDMSTMRKFSVDSNYSFWSLECICSSPIGRSIRLDLSTWENQRLKFDEKSIITLLNKSIAEVSYYRVINMAIVLTHG
jgi:hypothetical protein